MGVNKDQALEKVKQILEKMGSTDILFPEMDEETIVVKFNCKSLTSFVANIPGWNFSGIRLDTTNERQFRIDLKKAKTV